MTHPQPGDGNTIPNTVGRTGKRNLNPGVDQYFYFAVDDSFKLNGSPSYTIPYITVNYYDSGIIRRLFEIDAVDLQETPADAKALSGRLKTRAATFMGEDASSAMGYELWRDGEHVESIQWSGGAVSTFESALRQAPSWPGDDFAIADAIFAELGVYLPCCYGQADEGGDVEAYLAADHYSESRIDRADLVTL